MKKILLALLVATCLPVLGQTTGHFAGTSTPENSPMGFYVSSGTTKYIDIVKIFFKIYNSSNVFLKDTTVYYAIHGAISANSFATGTTEGDTTCFCGEEHWKFNGTFANGGTSASGTFSWNTNTRHAVNSNWTASSIGVAPGAAPTVTATAQSSSTINVSWTSTPGAQSYTLYRSTASGGPYSSLGSITTTNYSNSSLASNTAYYYEVRSDNIWGTTAYSTYSGATTWLSTPTSPSASALSDTSIQISWSSVSGATGYKIFRSATSGGALVQIGTSASTTYADNGRSSNTAYYYKIKAYNATVESDYSSESSATTVVSAPGGLAASSIVQTGATLAWSASIGAASYQLQVSTSGSFASTVYNQSSLVGTSQAVGSLTAANTYYFRVNATNTNGTSTWSSTQSFATLPNPPNSPTLSSPADAAIDRPTSLSLSWSAASGAITYHVQLSTSAAFSSLVLEDSALSGTSRSVGPLSTSTTYYWRVRAKNSGGTSAWSSTRSFTTVPAASGAPNLSLPDNGEKDQSLTPDLGWSPTSGAVTYHIQISKSQAFDILVAADSTLSVTTYKAGPLVASTLYYWRVRANNSGGVSAWSGVFSFTTLPAPPGNPVPESPAKGAGNRPPNLTLKWFGAARATSYSLQVAADANLTYLVLDDSSLIDTTRALANLAPNTQHFWRVRAKNAGGVSAWSSLFDFTTLPTAPSQPSLASPASNATGLAQDLNLSWNALAGATTYYLQVSTAANFGSLVFNDSTLTNPSGHVTGLVAGTTYYWRVQAANAGGASTWSATRNFTTSNTPVQVRKTALPKALNLAWSSVGGKRAFQLAIPHRNRVRLVVYQPGSGRSFTLLDAYLEAGWHQVVCAGSQSAGMYICRLTSGRSIKTFLIRL